MTVTELRQTLQELEAKGHGDKPIRVFDGWKDKNEWEDVDTVSPAPDGASILIFS